MHTPGPLLLVEEDASMNETRDQVIRLPNLMSCYIRCSAERSAELTNALLCRLMKKTPTRAGFRKCLKTPHEDYVHKVKRAASAISKKKNESVSLVRRHA